MTQMLTTRTAHKRLRTRIDVLVIPLVERYSNAGFDRSDASDHTCAPSTVYEQQVGPQHALASGLRARTNALATLPSTARAMLSTSIPTLSRNARASSA